MGNVRDFFADKFSFLGETVRDAAYRIRFLEEEPYDEEEAEYVRAKNERRIRTLFTVLVILAIAVAVLLVRRSADRRTYSGYEVVKAIDKADNVSEYRSSAIRPTARPFPPGKWRPSGICPLRCPIRRRRSGARAS